MANVSVNEKRGTPPSAGLTTITAEIAAAAKRNHKAISAFDEAQTLIAHAQSVLTCAAVAARSDEGLNEYSAGGVCDAVYSMLGQVNTHVRDLFREWQKGACSHE